MHFASRRFFSTSLSSLSFVSFRNLVSPSIPIKTRESSRLRDACQNTGFFYLTDWNALFPNNFSTILFRQSAGFFDQPLAHKNQFRMTERSPGRGYQGFGINITQGRPDFHESVDFMREEFFSCSDQVHQKDLIFTGKNAKPPQMWPFPFQDYVTIMQKIGMVLMESLLPATFLKTDAFSQSWWGLRVISYPIGNGLGCGEHCDYGFLTLVLQDSRVPDVCLEVKDKNGIWIPATAMANTLVVNIGDMLQFCSNGMYKSTPHRVQSPRTHRRLSIPFFFEPNYDTTITNHKGESLQYSHHLKSKIETNYSA